MDAKREGWWLQVFEQLHGALGPVDLFLRFQPLVQELGFCWCSYGIRASKAIPPSSPTVFDSYPPGWMEHYRGCDYLATDPTVELGTRASTMIVWSDDVFAGSPQLWQDARDIGLRVGIAQSAWGAHAVCGLLSVARDNVPLSPSELTHVEPRLKWLAENVHARMHALLGAELSDASPQPLSTRELEVLKWTADGKTSWEIGKILRISSSTVNFHISNIVAKLNAQNKLQAAVIAVTSGLIEVPPQPFRRESLAEWDQTA